MPLKLMDIHLDLQDHKLEDASIHEVVRQAAKDLHDIKTNHLAHIEPDMATIKADYRWIKWGVALVIGLLLKSLFFK